MGKKASKGETNILSLWQKSRIIGAQVLLAQALSEIAVILLFLTLISYSVDKF
jgi:hypothetical protein